MPLPDDGPSPADLDRFGDDTGYCPECGAEVYDQAPACPACGTFIEGRILSRPPVEHDLRKRIILVIVLLTLAAFVLVGVL